MTEYVLCYAKDIDLAGDFYGEAAYSEKEQPIVKRTNKRKTLRFPAGCISRTPLPNGSHKPEYKGSTGTALSFLNEIVVKDGQVVNDLEIEGPFVWAQEFLESEIKAGTSFSLSKKFGLNAARHDQNEKTKTPSSLLSQAAGIGTNEDASQELAAIFNTEQGKAFTYPKPRSLIEYLVRAVTLTKPDAIVLDSFAGSGTSAHAVLALNKQDGGNRRFILVECENYADTLTAERVRRVINGYPFTGTQRVELLREKLNWTKLKKAESLVEKAESIQKLEGEEYDDVKITVDDGELVITGERAVRETVPGLGGSFTYCTLGAEMSLEGLLTGKDLPAFDSLAKYVFYTATGRTLATVANQPKDGDGFIGETDHYRVHLLYKPDQSWLRSEAAVLTESKVEAIVADRPLGKRSLVFAAAKYLSQKDLVAHGVEFCQLPYAIHRILGDSAPTRA